MIDNKLDIFKEIAHFDKTIPFSINVQSSLHGNRYQIKRIMPHVITYCLDKEESTENHFKNDLIGLNKIIQAINEIEGFSPIIVVFKDINNIVDINDVDKYDKLILHNKEISLETVMKLSKTVNQKLAIKEFKNKSHEIKKVFLGTFDSANLLTFRRKIKILSLTESILYFHSEDEIPDWTIFHLTHPVPLLITVVPQKDDSNFKGQEGVYRALINGLGETGKAKIRSYVNNLIHSNNNEEES